jgi:AcrR family transcriptional regulator
MARTPAPGTRDCILDTAGKLFYEHGVHAVGLQQVIDEYGCGKNLLYREFPSKDALVVAWLERCRDESEAKLDEATRELDGDPASQLVAIVRTAAESVGEAGFRGCALRNSYAEFPDRDHPAHQTSLEYLKGVRARLYKLAKQAGAPDPDALADRLMLIIDGVTTNGSVFGTRGAVRSAVAFADDVVRAAVARTAAPARSTPRRRAPGSRRG